ncbi:hypothetical protein Tco_1056143 [Tanacetum coccineum]|uniref:Uncharacterized protein n=1 Tax=Tanacetum coccineum TaxID=301880 RepID=A0ABQ5H1T8_9ASTR
MILRNQYPLPEHNPLLQVVLCCELQFGLHPFLIVPKQFSLITFLPKGDAGSDKPEVSLATDSQTSLDSSIRAGMDFTINLYSVCRYDLLRFSGAIPTKMHHAVAIASAQKNKGSLEAESIDVRQAQREKKCGYCLSTTPFCTGVRGVEVWMLNSSSLKTCIKCLRLRTQCPLSVRTELLVLEEFVGFIVRKSLKLCVSSWKRRKQCPSIILE